jgi:hexosaminidase
MNSAINRTIYQLQHLPYVVSRGQQAEPGIEPHNKRTSSSSPSFHRQPTKTSVQLQVKVLVVKLKEADNGKDKQLNTDESYTLTLVPSTTNNEISALLQATNVYGALYGLSTFAQLFTVSSPSATTTSTTTPIVSGLPIHIHDSPRFPWRGILLDTANHFFPINDIQRTIDGMFMNRYNILHLHIIDSYSFPYQSTVYPKLVNGAWTTNDIYTPSDIKSLKDYAMKNYGIMIILEIDVPGHAYSWGIGYPDIVAKCPGYGMDLDIGHINAVPMDPSNEVTYDVITSVIRELITIISPQEFIHLGGDEINIGCWNYSNSTHVSSIKKWKIKNNYTWKEVIKIFYRTIWNEMMDHPTKPSPGGIQKIVTWEDLYLDDSTGTMKLIFLKIIF